MYSLKCIVLLVFVSDVHQVWDHLVEFLSWRLLLFLSLLRLRAVRDIGESCEVWRRRLGDLSFFLLHRMLVKVRKLWGLYCHGICVDGPIRRLVFHHTVLVCEDIPGLNLAHGTNQIVLIILRLLTWSLILRQDEILILLRESLSWCVVFIDRRFPFIEVIKSIELIILINQLVDSLLGGQIIGRFRQRLRHFLWILMQWKRQVLWGVLVCVWLLDGAHNSVG